jgi:hypothetical protein
VSGVMMYGGTLAEYFGAVCASAAGAVTAKASAAVKSLTLCVAFIAACSLFL